MNKIHGSIYLGDINDARDPNWKGDVISCLQDLPHGVPKKALWIPIIRTIGTLNEMELIADQDVDVVALRPQLDLVAREIQERFEKKIPTLVHCLGGMERSPLAMVYWLRKCHNFTYDSAYEHVKKIRPVVLNRLTWLNLSYDERMS